MPAISYETIDKGDHCGYATKGALLIRKQDEWERTWKQMHSRVTPQPALPRIDFAIHQAIFVCSGNKPCSGFKIEITDVVQEGDDLSLTVKETISEGELALAVQTQPYHLIQTPLTSGKIH